MVRKHNSLIGVMLLQRGDGDALLCGVASRFDNQLKYVQEVIGLKPGAKTFAAMNVLMLHTQTLFICDTHVNERSEEHPSELQSLMRHSYAVCRLNKKKSRHHYYTKIHTK